MDGRRLDLGDRPGDYDTSEPTVGCGACGGLVFQVEGGGELVCPECRAVLRLTYENVQPYLDRAKGIPLDTE
jgi:hypothetical protein